MKATFTYDFDTQPYYLKNSDEYEYDYEEHTYTVEDEEVLKTAIVNVLYCAYFDRKERLSFNKDQIVSIKNALRKLTDGNDNWQDLIDGFYNELKDYFRDMACEYFLG